jgi:hypothetical protein
MCECVCLRSVTQLPIVYLLSPSHRKWKELSNCHHLVISFSALYFDASFEDQKLSDDIKLPPHKFFRPQCYYFWWQKFLKLLCLGVIQRHNMRNKFCENRLNVQSLGLCADLQKRAHIHTDNRDLKRQFFISQSELPIWTEAVSCWERTCLSMYRL